MHMKGVLAGGAQGGHGAAVEAIVQGDDPMAARPILVVGVLPGRLDGALVGLRAGITKEYRL